MGNSSTAGRGRGRGSLPRPFRAPLPEEGELAVATDAAGEYLFYRRVTWDGTFAAWSFFALS